MARRTLHLCLVILSTALLALAGCGGGGGDAPADTAPAQQAQATIGPAGGTVAVQELGLNVPPAALSGGVAISLRRDTPAADEIARYTLAPAGQALAAPTELRFERNGLSASAAMFWEVGGERWLLPTTRSGNVLTAQLKSLGYAPASAAAPASLRARVASARPLADGAGNSANLVVQQLDCQAHALQLGRRLERVDLATDMPLAIGIAEDIVATEAACTAIEAKILEERSCDGLARALSQAEAVFAKDLAEFNSIVAPLYAAKSFVQLTGATCANADPARVDALVEAKFDQVLAVVQSQQLRGDFGTEPGLRQLGVVLSYSVPCQQLGLGATCTRLSQVILPNVVDAMRSAAFDQCRANGLGFAVSQLHALGAGDDDASKFLDFGRFGKAGLEADLSYCTAPTLDLHVFDSSSGVPEELADRAQTLQALVGQGVYTTRATVAVPRTGSLTVGGSVKALQCADGSFSPAALVARINGVEIARRAVSGSDYSIGTAPLDLDVARVLAAAGLDVDKATAFTVTLFREGGQCAEPTADNPQRTVFTAPFKMFELQVNLPQATPVVMVLRGSLNLGFNALEVDNTPDLVQPRRKETSLTLTGQLEERSGNLVLVSSSADVTIVQTSGSVRTLRGTNGSNCSFEHVFAVERTTTLVAGLGQRNQVDLSLTATELAASEFSVQGPTRLTVKSHATLRNQQGDCSGIDTSPPPDTNDTFDGGPLSLTKLLSLARNPAFRAPVATDATGRRRVTLSGSTSDSVPVHDNVTESQSSSISVILADEPQ